MNFAYSTESNSSQGKGQPSRYLTWVTAIICAGALGLASSGFADDGKSPPEKKAPTKDDYSLDSSLTSSNLKLNEDGLFSLAIIPVEGLKVHPDAPLEVRLNTSAGLVSSKKKLGRKDATDEKALAPTIQTIIRGETAGKKEIEANISFFLCSKSWCQRMTDRVSIGVKVSK
jgi:hypothetical protein